MSFPSVASFRHSAVLKLDENKASDIKFSIGVDSTRP